MMQQMFVLFLSVSVCYSLVPMSSTLGNRTPPFLLVGHQEKGLFPCDSTILYVFHNVVIPVDAQSTDFA